MLQIHAEWSLTIPGRLQSIPSSWKLLTMLEIDFPIFQLASQRRLVPVPVSFPVAEVGINFLICLLTYSWISTSTDVKLDIDVY
jgi:hypothetical protein